MLVRKKNAVRHLSPKLSQKTLKVGHEKRGRSEGDKAAQLSDSPLVTQMEGQAA